MRKLLAFAVALILLVPGAYAAWQASITGNLVFQIDSTEPLLIDIPVVTTILHPMMGTGDVKSLMVEVINDDDISSGLLA